MKLLTLIATLLLFSSCGQTDEQDKSNSMTINSDCENLQKAFNKKLKEITWDKVPEKSNDKLINNDFFNKYLKDIKGLKKGDEYLKLYFHSIPDINTEKCLVIIKSAWTFELESYSYTLVELGKKPKVILELANLEDYPDGQRRTKSIFLNDSTLIKTKVTEYLGDQDERTKKYEIMTDSLTLTYRLRNNEFTLTKTDSIRTIKK